MLFEWNYDYQSMRQEKWFNVWRAKELAYPFVDALNERWAAARAMIVVDRDRYDTSQFKTLSYPKAGTSTTLFWAQLYASAWELGVYYLRADYTPGSRNILVPLMYLADPDKYNPDAAYPATGWDNVFTYDPDWAKITAKYRRSIPGIRAKSQPGKARLEATGINASVSNPIWNQDIFDPSIGQYVKRFDLATPLEDIQWSGWIFEHSGSGWQPVAQTGQGDLVEEQRIGIKRGDIFGPWILSGIRDMINKCTKTYKTSANAFTYGMSAAMPGLESTGGGGPLGDFKTSDSGGGPYNYRYTSYLDDWYNGSGAFPCGISQAKIHDVSHDVAWSTAVDDLFVVDSQTCLPYIINGHQVPRNAAAIAPWLSSGGVRSFNAFPISNESAQWTNPVGNPPHYLRHNITLFSFKWTTAWLNLIDGANYPTPPGQNGQGLQSNVKRGGWSESLTGDQDYAKCTLSAYCYARSMMQDGVSSIWKYNLEPGPYYEGSNLTFGWNHLGTVDSWDSEIISYSVPPNPWAKIGSPDSPTPYNGLTMKTCDVTCLLAICDFAGGQGFYYQGVAS